MAMQNGDICKFSKAEQEWDTKLLFRDIEARHKKLTASEQRNLKALLLGISPKDASLTLVFAEKSLKSAFSDLYRLIEELVDQPEKSVSYRNVPLVLAKYRKRAILLGRDDDLIELEKLKNQYKSILIKEDAGMGKTLLAEHFMEMHFQKVITINMGLSSSEVTPATEKLSTILSQLGIERSSYFETNLEALKKALSDRSNPVGVLIDNLEPALDKDFRFRDSNYDCLLRVLCDRNICSFTLITSRIAPSIQGINHQQFYEYKLKGLGLAAWQKCFRDCKNAETSEALSQMRNFYAGNPEAMAKLEGIISDRDNFDGDIEAYWKKYKHTSLANPDLKHLTSVQIDYLQNHQPDVYKLLCRMGCYRYQTVPTIPHEGLICLMWDVLESQHNAIVERLKKYSLIKITKGEYYLHPATREAAKERLEENKLDWEIANQKAAQFWEEQVKTIEIVDDALKAFESYHHYLAIDNHNAACETITRERECRWEKHIQEDGRLGEPLGYSYLRLGLLESITVATQAVLLKTDKQLVLARACNLLGDLLWLTGKPYVAIYYHEKTHDIALNKHNEYPKLKRLHYSSLLNRGLCYLSLCEVRKAHSFFLDLQNLSLNEISEQKMTHLGKYNLFRSNFCLSLTYSLIGDKENSLICIDKSILTSNEQIFYSAWSKGYSLIFIAQTYKNIRYLEKSNTKYQEAIKFADDSNYFQVKAMALYGIGELERINYQYFSALSYIQSAVEILQKIQAKHDLSEAYFQLGLTYQAMGEHNQAKEYKDKALELFEQMEAPKQCDRVNKAFEQGAIK